MRIIFFSIVLFSGFQGFLAANQSQRIYPAENKRSSVGKYSCPLILDVEVQTKKGNTLISELKVGDEVLSVPDTQFAEHKTVASTYQKVTGVYKGKMPEIIKLSLKDSAGRIDTMILSPGKQLYIKGEGYKALEELQEGDISLNKDKEPLSVVSIKQVYTGYNPTAQEGYAINVAGNHTFFAGEQGVLMHNGCGVSKSQSREIRRVDVRSRYGADAQVNHVLARNKAQDTDAMREFQGRFANLEGRIKRNKGLLTLNDRELNRSFRNTLEYPEAVRSKLAGELEKMQSMRAEASRLRMNLLFQHTRYASDDAFSEEDDPYGNRKELLAFTDSPWFKEDLWSNKR